MDKSGWDAEDPKIPTTFHTNKAKYAKTVSTSDTTKTGKAIFEVKESTDIKQMIAFSIDLMYNKQFPHVKLRGFGKNMEKCVFIAEQMKRKVRNLHQINAIETVQTIERFVPIAEEDGYYAFEKIKSQTVLTITLSRQTPLNVKNPGYQKPLESKFVSTRDPREYIRYVLEEKKVPTKKKLMAAKREGKPFRQGGDDDEGDDFRDHRSREESPDNMHNKQKWEERGPGPVTHQRQRPETNKGRSYFDNRGGDGRESGEDGSRARQISFNARGSEGGKWGRDPGHHDDLRNRNQSERRPKQWHDKPEKDQNDNNKHDTDHAEDWDDDPKAHNSNYNPRNRPWKGPGEYNYPRRSDNRGQSGNQDRDYRAKDDHHNQDRQGRTYDDQQKGNRKNYSQKEASDFEEKAPLDSKITLAKFEPRPHQPTFYDTADAHRHGPNKPRRHDKDDEYVIRDNPPKANKPLKHDKWRKNNEVEYVEKKE